jgi:hypothetical protein
MSVTVSAVLAIAFTFSGLDLPIRGKITSMLIASEYISDTAETV